MKQVGYDNIPSLGRSRGIWSLRESHRARVSGVWPFIPPSLSKTVFQMAVRDGAVSHWGFDQFSTYRDSILASGPVAYWPMGEDVQDEVGDHDGSHISGTSVVEGPHGPGTRYASGESSVPGHADLNQAGSDITVEFWLYLYSLTSNSGVLGTTSDGVWTGSGWLFYARSTAGAALAWTINGSSAYRFGNLPVGRWQHIACVLEGGMGVAYLDGEEVNPPVSLGAIGDAGGQPLRMGRFGGLSDLDGALSEVAIYDRALGQEELASRVGGGSAVVDVIGDNNISLASAALAAPFTYEGGSSLATGHGEITTFDARTDELTLEAWVRVANHDGVTTFMHNGDPTASGYGLRVNGGLLELTFGGVADGRLNGPPTIPVDKATHVVLTRTGGLWTLYVNSQVAGSGTEEPSPVAVDDPFSLTASEHVSIDGVSFYPHALTEGQVLDHYKAGIGTLVDLRWRPPVPYPPFSATSDGQSGTVHSWTVPETGTYEIVAVGAAGGGELGGRGARIQTNIDLVEGEIIKILAGQEGSEYPSGSSGGGGGSFVWRDATTELLVAAGGGGGIWDDIHPRAEYADASIGTGGRDGAAGEGGVDGQGGTTTGVGASGWGGAGAGWLSDGEDAVNLSGTGGRTRANDFGGGGSSGSNGAFGGFGGGGGTHGNTGGGGGGGGYSGGGGGNQSSSPGCGGGGGSFAAGNGTVGEEGVGDGHGSVIITRL